MILKSRPLCVTHITAGLPSHCLCASCKYIYSSSTSSWAQRTETRGSKYETSICFMTCCPTVPKHFPCGRVRLVNLPVHCVDCLPVVIGWFCKVLNEAVHAAERGAVADTHPTDTLKRQGAQVSKTLALDTADVFLHCSLPDSRVHWGKGWAVTPCWVCESAPQVCVTYVPVLKVKIVISLVLSSDVFRWINIAGL